ncbi:MAG: hypothetical protein IPJ88_04290 [Myxococcales bacterium]|nr:MAG: hypothetical protein IPJ88_04290 [Myxococcales bacterium]
MSKHKNDEDDMQDPNQKSSKQSQDALPTAIDPHLAERLLQAFPSYAATQEPKTTFDPDLPKRLKELHSEKNKSEDKGKEKGTPDLLDQLAPLRTPSSRPKAKSGHKQPAQKVLTSTVIGEANKVVPRDIEKRDLQKARFAMPPEADGTHTRFQKALSLGKKQIQTLPNSLRVLVAALLFAAAVALGWLAHPAENHGNTEEVTLSKKQRITIPDTPTPTKPSPHDQETIPEKKTVRIQEQPKDEISEQDLEKQRAALEEKILSTEKFAVEALISGQTTDALAQYQRLNKLLNHDKNISTFVEILERENNRSCSKGFGQGGKPCTD